MLNLFSLHIGVICFRLWSLLINQILIISNLFHGARFVKFDCETINSINDIRRKILDPAYQNSLTTVSNISAESVSLS